MRSFRASRRRDSTKLQHAPRSSTIGFPSTSCVQNTKNAVLVAANTFGIHASGCGGKLGPLCFCPNLEKFSHTHVLFKEEFLQIHGQASRKRSQHDKNRPIPAYHGPKPSHARFERGANRKTTTRTTPRNSRVGPPSRPEMS